MLLRLIKNNRAGGIVFIIILMMLLWLKSFLHPVMIEPDKSMPFYDAVFGWISQTKILSVLTGLVFYAILIVLIVRFNVIHFLLEDRSYMPAVFFLLLNVSFPHPLQINPFLISTVFMVLALLILIKGDEHRADPLALFNATLLLAVGSLFYLKVIWFIPFLWITAAVIRPLKWRGLINPILVLSMMALFHVCYYWVFRDDLSLFTRILHNNLEIYDVQVPHFETAVWILFSYLFLLIAVSSFHLLSRYQARKIIIRKLYKVLFMLFVYCTLFYILISGYNPEVIILLAIPVAYLFSNYFQRKKNHWIHEVMIWIWLILIAYVQLLPLAAN